MTQVPRTPPTSTPSRVPVALYIATSAPESAELLADYCRQYAMTHGWDAVGIVTDIDRTAPLMSRPEWPRVLSLLSDGTVRGVVTYSRGMIAAPQDEYDVVREFLRDRGAFLAAARTAGRGTPPRRTPGQTARRQTIADAAAGYEGCGAETSE
ncbi:recombinase family protein [Streptomyces sioyaensis]|uniref:recombinase family protein n=1 Tax=Streptomyces sioyaensis TaxID=67364 RepID=UPI0037D4F846